MECLHLVLRFLYLLLSIKTFRFLQTAWRRSGSRDGLPPGPVPLPIIGNLLLLGSQPHRNLARLSKTYGPIMTLKLGSVTTIVVSSPEIAKEVLQTKDQSFSSRPYRDTVHAMDFHKSSIAWLPADQQWRGLRKVCTVHLFSSRSLAKSRRLREEKLRELVDYLSRPDVAGQPVHLSAAASVMVINLISNSLFSADIVGSDPDSSWTVDFKDAFRLYMEETGAFNLSDFFPILRPADLQGHRRRVAGNQRKMHSILKEVMDRRLEGRPQGDFLDALLEEGSYDHHAIKCLLSELFFAGGDTTLLTIEWAMVELLRHPDTMEKLRSELVMTVGTEKVVRETDISRMPFLKAVVKETLRLHPATPMLLPHVNDTGMELCGYNVPKGSQIYVNNWAISHDGSIWEEPERFWPERFLESDLELLGKDFRFIPFGSGRRMCPGLPLASLMVHLTLGTLVHEFHWELPEGVKPSDVDLTEKFGSTLPMAVPLKVVPFRLHVSV